MGFMDDLNDMFNKSAAAAGDMLNKGASAAGRMADSANLRLSRAKSIAAGRMPAPFWAKA